jgi:hypothetical protein
MKRCFVIKGFKKLIKKMTVFYAERDFSAIQAD